jgi:hypothetical protein
VPESHSNDPERLTTRDAVEDFMAAIGNVNTREPDVQQEAHARGLSDNPFGIVERNEATDDSPPLNSDDLFDTMLSDRDLSSAERDIKPRSLLSSLFGIGMDVLSHIHILRRDVTPELLAARDGEGGFDSDTFTKVLNALSSSRRDFVDDALAARDGPPGEFDSDGFTKVLDALSSSRRDVVDDALAARDDPEDFNSDTFAKVLNALSSSRRDAVDDPLAARGDWEDFVNTLNTRELDFKRDMQARAS